jgi:hypothetical protein
MCANNFFKKLMINILKFMNSEKYDFSITNILENQYNAKVLNKKQ